MRRYSEFFGSTDNFARADRDHVTAAATRRNAIHRMSAPRERVNGGGSVAVQ
jgi:hypothetical protein